jgi:hypothetical protein
VGQAERAASPISRSSTLISDNFDEKHLVDARNNAGIALSELIHSLEKRFPPQEKIDKAKQAVDVWIEALR